MASPKPQRIPLGDLIVDQPQRAFIPARAKALEQKPFDIDKTGVFHVSKRADGSLHIMDGQHRWNVGMKLGLGDKRVLCLVYEGLSVPQEAERFVELNDVRNPSAIEKFKMNVLAEDPTCVAVNDMIGEYGWKVSAKSEQGCVSCPDRLVAMYCNDPELLRSVLALITDTWGHESGSTDRMIIAGAGILLGRFNGELDSSALVKKLAANTTPQQLVGHARSLTEIRKMPVGRATAEIMRDIYNSKRRSGALPPL